MWFDVASVQYVIFKLGEDIYGAQIHNVQEIILPKEPTRVPNNPDFIEGIIDYRDEVIPLLDLKKRFNLGESRYSGETRLVVVRVDDRNIAFSVDEVTEILWADEDQIDKAPEMTRIKKEFITGVARIDEKLIIILDLAKVLSVEEQDVLDTINI